MASITWDGAKVTSRARVRPHFQGVTVKPSGLFPSDRQTPDGSRWAGTPAVTSDRWISSFRYVSCQLARSYQIRLLLLLYFVCTCLSEYVFVRASISMTMYCIDLLPFPPLPWKQTFPWSHFACSRQKVSSYLSTQR